MRRTWLAYVVAAAAVWLGETVWGQKASNWRVFRLADGVPESACVSVTFSPQGRVLARHLQQERVSILDGYNVTVVPGTEIGKGRVYESPAGQLWTAVPQGLMEYWDEVWQLHRVEEIAAEFRGGVARVINPVPLYPVRHGQVLFLLPGGLMQFNAEGGGKTTLIKSAETAGIGPFTSMTVARDGGFWVAAKGGVAKAPGPVRSLQPETEWQVYPVPESFGLQNVQDPYESERGVVVALGVPKDGMEKWVLQLEGTNWVAGPRTSYKLRYAWRGPEQEGWAMTISSLLRWGASGEMVENDEISARQYFDLAVEPSGAFWLATSDGLFRYAALTWQTPAGLGEIAGPVQCVAEGAGGSIWFVSGNSLHRLAGEEVLRFPFPERARDLVAPHSLSGLRNGSLLIAWDEPEKGGDAVMEFNPRTEAYRGLAAGRGDARQRVLGRFGEAAVCLQVWPEGAENTNYILETYDGLRRQVLSRTAGEAGAGTNLSAFFATRRGDLWISGELGTAVYQEQKWRLFPGGNVEAPESAVDFAELGDGRIYAATREAIWEFDGRNWSVLRRGLDRVNGMTLKGDGGVWVASNGGLYRYQQGAWVENGVEEGLGSGAIRQVMEDRRGRLWAATTRGLSLYHPEADPDAPQSLITTFAEKENRIQHGVPVTLAYTGRDKWKYTPRDRLLFSHRLDDSDWSAFSDNTAIQLAELSAGKHFFQVRAMDRNGNIEAKPAQVELLVVLPWYQETRLVVIACLGMAGALFFAGLAFNRHRRLLRSYAEVEQKVAERSHQLEQASLELLQSQKMKALGTLAAGIAHDFNNILSIIKGSAQLIEDNLESPEKVRKRVDRINTVVEQGAGIVKAMLGFSRESNETSQAVSRVEEVIRETITLLGDRFLREVQVRYQAGPELPPVQVPAAFIQQILLNFIFNAADSMAGVKERKTAVVSARMETELEAGMALVPEAAGEYIAVSVQDFGCGIAPENLDRIFEPFFTTKAFSSRRGTGLGLSMVYEIAKKFGGGLAVKSTPGEGSTFTLLIPVRPAAQNAPGRERAAEVE